LQAETLPTSENFGLTQLVATRGWPVYPAGVQRSAEIRADECGSRHQAGCTRVYKNVGSGSLKHRPELDACLDYLRAGDTLVVWRLDRLGRGLKHLIEAIEQLHAREIGFRSLTEAIDTTTNAGMLQFHIFGALAEFVRHAARGITSARSSASGPARASPRLAPANGSVGARP